MEQLLPASLSPQTNPPTVTQKQKSDHHDETVKTRTNKSHRERRGDTETKGNHAQPQPASTEGVKSRKCGSQPLPRQSDKRQPTSQHDSIDSIPSVSKTVPTDRPKNVFQHKHSLQILKSVRNISPPRRKESTSEKPRMHNSLTNRQERHPSATCTQITKNIQKQFNTQHQTRENIFVSTTANSPAERKLTGDSSRSRQRHRSACPQMICSSRTSRPVQQEQLADPHSAPATGETDGPQYMTGKASKNPEGHRTCTSGEASIMSSRVSSSELLLSFQCPKSPENHATCKEETDIGKRLETRTSKGDETLHVAQISQVELEPTKESGSVEVDRCGESIRTRCLRHINKPHQQGHSSKGHALIRRKHSPADDPKEPKPLYKKGCATASGGHEPISTPPRYPNYLKPKSGFFTHVGKSYMRMILKKCRINVVSSDESHIPAQDLGKEESSKMETEDSKTNDLNKQESVSIVSGAQAECSVNLPGKEMYKDDMGTVESHQSSLELSEAKGAASESDDMEESKTYDLNMQECPSKVVSASAKNSVILLAGATYGNHMGTVENHPSNQKLSEAKGAASSDEGHVIKLLHGGRTDSLEVTQTEQSLPNYDRLSGPNQAVPMFTPAEGTPEMETLSKNVEGIGSTTTPPPFTTAHTLLPACIVDEDGEMGFVEENYPNREEMEHTQQVTELSNFYHTLQNWKRELLAMHAALDRSPFDAVHGTCSLCHKESNGMAPRDSQTRHFAQELRRVVPQFKQPHPEIGASEECCGSEGKEPCREEPLKLHISHCSECRELITAPLQQSFHILMDDMDLLLDTLEIFHLPDRPAQHDSVHEEVNTDNDNRSSSCQEITSGKDYFVPQVASCVQSESEVKRDVLNFVFESKILETGGKSLTSVPYYKPVCCSSESLENSQYLNRRMCSETASILKKKQITKQDHFSKTLEYFSDSCLANCYIIHKKAHKELKAKHSTAVNGPSEHDKATNEGSVGQKQEKTASLPPSYRLLFPESDEMKCLGENAENCTNGRLNINTEGYEAKRAEHIHEVDGSVLPPILHNPDVELVEGPKVPILPPTVRHLKQVREEQLLTSRSDQLGTRRNRFLGKFLLRYIKHIENRLTAVQSEGEHFVKSLDSSKLLPRGVSTENTSKAPVVLKLAQVSDEGFSERLETLVKSKIETEKSASQQITRNRRQTPTDRPVVVNPEVGDFSLPPRTTGSDPQVSRDLTSPPLESPTVLCTSSCVSVTGSEEGERGQVRREDSEVQQAFSSLGQALQHLAQLMDTSPHKSH